MEEAGSSCCSPQRPDNVSTVIAPEFFPVANLTKANFVTIPAGEFLMGTDEPFYPTDGEGPSRSVWLDEFKISQYSVTNSEFAAFIEATGYQTEAEMYGWSYVFNGFIDDTTASKQVAGVAASAPWWLAIEGAYWFKPYGNSQTIEDSLDHPVAVSYTHLTLPTKRIV